MEAGLPATSPVASEVPDGVGGGEALRRAPVARRLHAEAQPAVPPEIVLPAELEAAQGTAPGDTAGQNQRRGFGWLLCGERGSSEFSDGEQQESGGHEDLLAALTMDQANIGNSLRGAIPPARRTRGG